MRIKCFASLCPVVLACFTTKRQDYSVMHQRYGSIEPRSRHSCHLGYFQVSIYVKTVSLSVLLEVLVWKHSSKDVDAPVVDLA